MTCTLMAAAALLLPGADLEPRPGTASNASFLVLAAPDGRLAEPILERADAVRRRVAREWLGRELPDGTPFTFIDARIASDKDTGLTLPPIARKNGPVRVWVVSPDEDTLLCALSHELVHVVLRERFPDGMPAWANEGAASLEDDAARVRLRQQLVSQWARTGKWPSIERIIARQSLRPGDLEAYAVSAETVAFLIAKEGRLAFLDFVEDGQRSGWDKAASRAYGYATVAELETAWRASVIRRNELARTAAKQADSPLSERRQ